MKFSAWWCWSMIWFLLCWWFSIKRTCHPPWCHPPASGRPVFFTWADRRDICGKKNQTFNQIGILSKTKTWISLRPMVGRHSRPLSRNMFQICQNFDWPRLTERNVHNCSSSGHGWSHGWGMNTFLGLKLRKYLSNIRISLCEYFSAGVRQEGAARRHFGPRVPDLGGAAGRGRWRSTHPPTPWKGSKLGTHLNWAFKSRKTKTVTFWCDTDPLVQFYSVQKVK